MVKQGEGSETVRKNTRSNGKREAIRPFLRSVVVGMVLIGWGMSAGAVAAHQVYVFASPVGTRIEGRAYFRGGSPCKHCPVRLIVGDEAEPIVVETDDDGNFAYELAEPHDVRIVVDAGEGHTAEYTIAAEEFGTGSGDASREGDETAAASGQEEAASDGRAEADVEEPSAEVEAGQGDEMTVQLAALRMQIVRLREDVQSLRERLWLRDILGGIGFILGLTGIAYYFAMRKQADPKATPRESENENESHA